VNAPLKELRPSSTWPRIVDLVFQPFDSRRAAILRVVVAVVLAISAHGALVLAARLSQPPLSAWTAEMLDEVSRRLVHEQEVDVTPPPPSPPPPPPKAEAPPPPVARAAVARSAPSTPPPPAEAGKVIAQEPDPDAPVDLAGDTIVTGTGSVYAGGMTSASGTNKTAVESPVVDAKAAPTPNARAAPDRSSPIRLADDDWTCPWPHQADDAEVDEQTALVRVNVRVDGTPETAQVLQDPGLGFGPAAVACAMRARYLPAHDREGRPVATVSPPIRVRFTR
jgi:protein TonB